MKSPYCVNMLQEPSVQPLELTRVTLESILTKTLQVDIFHILIKYISKKEFFALDMPLDIFRVFVTFGWNSGFVGSLPVWSIHTKTELNLYL